MDVVWPDLNNMLQYLPGFGSVTVLALDVANFRRYLHTRQVASWCLRLVAQTTEVPSMISLRNPKHKAPRWGWRQYHLERQSCALGCKHGVSSISCGAPTLYTCCPVWSWVTFRGSGNFCLLDYCCSVLNLILLSLSKKKQLFMLDVPVFAKIIRVRMGWTVFTQQLRQCADTQVLATCPGNVPSTFNAKQPYGP